MKKFLLACIITSIAIMGGVFADDNDCGLWKTNDLSGAYQKSVVKYTNVLPMEGFNKAVINLKAYCCLQTSYRKYCTKEEKANLPELYPESAYLFDHLVDVMMRRLDGISALAYNLEPDPTGKERRTYITKVAGDTNGAQASTIQSTYAKYRTLHENTIKDIGTVITNYNTDVTTLSLEDKYKTLCDIANRIYGIMKANNNVVNTVLNHMSNCEALAQTGIDNEEKYAKLIMIQKSNQLFFQTTQAYTKKYFVEEKLTALWNIISSVKDMFKTIVLQAPASKTCSQ